MSSLSRTLEVFCLIGLVVQVFGQFPYSSTNLNSVKLGDRTYFFVDEAVSWFDAASFCPLIEMDLATINTKDEHQLVSGYLHSMGWFNTRVVWIGGHSLGTTVWSWLSGAPMTNFTGGWAANQPDSPATEHCMAYWIDNWRNYPCLQTVWDDYAKTAFACEERSIQQP